MNLSLCGNIASLYNVISGAFSVAQELGHCVVYSQIILEGPVLLL